MVKIFYDTETTGVKPLRHSIHQLAGLVEVNGKVVEEFDIRMAPHPKALIDIQALRIAKVTREQVLGYQPMSHALKQFVNIVGKYVDPYDKNTRAYLVGFNNRSFDDEFLVILFAICDNDALFSYFWHNTLDTMVLASQYLIDRRTSMPSFKLKRVATELGIEYDKNGLHDALFDARLTRKIYRIVTGLDFEL